MVPDTIPNATRNSFLSIVSWKATYHKFYKILIYLFIQITYSWWQFNSWISSRILFALFSGSRLYYNIVFIGTRHAVCCVLENLLLPLFISCWCFPQMRQKTFSWSALLAFNDLASAVLNVSIAHHVSEICITLST